MATRLTSEDKHVLSCMIFIKCAEHDDGSLCCSRMTKSSGKNIMPRQAIIES